MTVAQSGESTVAVGARVTCRVPSTDTEPERMNGSTHSLHEFEDHQEWNRIPAISIQGIGVGVNVFQ